MQKSRFSEALHMSQTSWVFAYVFSCNLKATSKNSGTFENKKKVDFPLQSCALTEPSGPWRLFFSYQSYAGHPRFA